MNTAPPAAIENRQPQNQSFARGIFRCQAFPADCTQWHGACFTVPERFSRSGARSDGEFKIRCRDVSRSPRRSNSTGRRPRSSSSTCSATFSSRAVLAKHSATTSRSLRARCSRSCRAQAARENGMLVIHTREGICPTFPTRRRQNRARRAELASAIPGRWDAS